MAWPEKEQKKKLSVRAGGVVEKPLTNETSAGKRGRALIGLTIGKRPRMHLRHLGGPPFLHGPGGELLHGTPDNFPQACPRWPGNVFPFVQPLRSSAAAATDEADAMCSPCPCAASK